MQFSEHEMTTALDGLAKAYLAAQPSADGKPAVVDATGETQWAALSKFERYQTKASLSEYVFPVFAALPSVAVEPGQRAVFSPEQISEAANVSVRVDAEADRLDGRPEQVVADIRAQLSAVALACLPVKPRETTDEETMEAFVVPDSLEGL